ncbi:NAD-dependent epimerase/dehydratase family protein [Planctomycetes bacterium K23_9]|uniref:NAD dependent epimerase/dehydratase family protein n=1 Tax=Stieleria marina TaxID=1930275 RepID=A0A517NSK2_9BACT|nr:NAD dependent epimerase/dehydratase family protein [Planctomycetes bacterium K23_9]
MTTVLVTGSDGLIGWHFRCFLSTLEDVNVTSCNRSQFADDDYLSEAVRNADVIVHFAGMNRGEEDEIYATNVALAERLALSCKSSGNKPHVIYSSSTHIDGPTRYGESKRVAGEILAKNAAETDSTCTNLILPHVFGEHGKPFYNSAVSTFAHQIANGETPSVTGDGQLSLLHTGDVAKIAWKAAQDRYDGDLRPDGTPLKVTELAELLQHLASRYASGTVPNLDNLLHLQMFNTYRSYIPHAKRPVDLTLHSDPRGSLFEAIRSDGQGQTFLSTTKPGITRGNHFHLHKVERFLVVQGKAKIRLRKVLTNETHVFDVDGEVPQAIDIPTLHTHNITNVGDEPLLTLFWSAELFNPDAPDTYFLEVDLPQASNA